MKQAIDNKSLKHGRVLWYDAARGYGFLSSGTQEEQIFITKRALDDFGITNLNTGFELVFDVVKGRQCEKVKNIIQVKGAHTVQ